MERKSTTIGRIKMKSKFIEEVNMNHQIVCDLYNTAWEALTRTKYIRKFVWTRLRFEDKELPINYEYAANVLDPARNYIRVSTNILKFNEYVEELFISQEDFNTLCSINSVKSLLRHCIRY